MKISEIKLGDVVVLRNGEETIVGQIHLAIIKSLYKEVDNMLLCDKGTEYDIVKIMRPMYYTLYDMTSKEENKNVR